MVLWLVFGVDLRRLERVPEPGPRLPADRGRRAAPAACSTCRSARRRTRTRCCRRSLVLVLAMAFTAGRGRRLRRRRALSLAIGWFAGLVLGGVVGAQGGVLVAGVRRRRGPHAALLAAVAGPASSRSCSGWPRRGGRGRRFGLRDPARRREFWRTGRLAIERGGAMIVVRPPRRRPRSTATAGCRVASTSSCRERGREQAARARRSASPARPVARVFTSPLQRARADRRPRSPRCAARTVEVDERLIELDYGEWDGRPLADIAGRAVGRVARRSRLRAAGRREPRRR